MLFVEVAPTASVIWTKPDDLDVADDLAVFNKLAKQSMPDRLRSDVRFLGFYALFGDGAVRGIPFATDRNVLRRATRVDDGVTSGIRRKDDY